MRLFRSASAPPLAARRSARAEQIAVVGGLLLLALVPRLWGLADFLTTDEAYHWIERTERFSAAVNAAAWADTNLTGHPGVTLMWLGSLGHALERVAMPTEQVANLPLVVHLAWLRLPTALLEALAVPLVYLLLRRLFAPFTATIAALLWAISPYLIAHGRLLHLDMLLTTFVTLSVLALLQMADGRWQIASDLHRPSLRPFGSAVRELVERQGKLRLGQVSIVHCPSSWLIASGICAGLALLTKGPALILLPYVGLWLFWSVSARTLGERLLRSLALYVVWLAVALAVVFVLWPALWVDMPGALQRYIGEIMSNGGRPNGDGQFFLGRAVADPGPLFYPVANLLRTTPTMLVGLLGALAYGGAAFVKRQAGNTLNGRERRALLALGAFALFWTLVMTLGPKKFDRYVLPIWPALLVFAAIGWRALLRGLRAIGGVPRLLGPLLFAGLLLFDGAQLALLHPYYLSYYNPLLGGGAVAQRTLLIGWGEGMDQVGAALRARPDAEEGQILAALGATLQPFVPVPVRDVTKLDTTQANYAVVYLESIQRGANPEIYREIQQTAPVAQVVINGITYATIHQLPKPFQQPLGAQFGPALHLRGFSLARASGQLLVTPSWDVRARPAADYLLFLHLIDQSGQRVAQVDVAPGGGDAPATGAWQAGQQIAVPISLALPEALPPGDYRLVMGLYNPATGARVPFTGAPSADSALAGPDALLLDTLTLP